MGEKYERASGHQECSAGFVPTFFVGELVRANAKGMNVFETARAGMKGVRCRERRLLTQSEASSLEARLPVGNDCRICAKVDASFH